MSNSNVEIYAKMQAGKPFKSFKKTVPAWLHVLALDPFDDTKTEYLHLKGNPDTNEIETYIPLWSEKEYLFFKRANKIHIQAGRLVEAIYPESDKVEKSVNELTDAEIAELVKGPFLTLSHKIDKINSEATVYRMIKIANDLERPEKTLAFLREKLSILQSGVIEELESEEEN